ncbi:MAG: ATPase [Myxococcota bacterium]
MAGVDARGEISDLGAAVHILFVSPEFPRYQLDFVRALTEVGARVTGLGEAPPEALPPGLKARLYGYINVGNVTDEGRLLDAVRLVQSREWVDRLEATIEAHVLPVARVREAATIPGLSARTALLCRDKPLMKDFLRERGVPTAASTGVQTVDEALAFARGHGYPLVVKPRAGAGAAGTSVVHDEGQLRAALAGFGPVFDVALEQFDDGHEGFYDTLTVGGDVAHEFVAHYYPNVLEAMRTRWVSPQIVVTNRIAQSGYDEVRDLGRKVIRELSIDTAPTHMEWFFGSHGLRFSEIGARPPGVSQWDLYATANELDLYREWADSIVYGRTWGRASRRFSSGIIALRPDRDGVIDRIEGIDEMQRRFGGCVINAHLPAPGTPTQPVEAGYMANAWVQLRHPDYDTLRDIMNTIGERIQVYAH